MRTPPNVVLRGLAKFLAVTLAAGVVGVGLGIGLAELSGDDDGAGVAVPRTATPTTATATSTATTQTETTTTRARTTTTADDATPSTTTSAAQNVSRTTRVQILSAVLYPAATASGRARDRARLIVRVRLTSSGTSTIPARPPLLIAGSAAIRSDRQANDSAGALLRALPPGDSATGELFFETADDAAELLTTRSRARLSIAQRTVDVPIRVSTTPAPPG